MESYHYIRNARDDYEYILKKFSAYSRVEVKKQDCFSYLSRYDDEGLRKLYEIYNLSRFRNDSNEISTLINVLRWSHEVLLYREQDSYHGKENAMCIIEYCKKRKKTVNCRLHAIVLTEALLALGFEARIVCCMPIDVLPFDNHTLATVYSHELDKWIALDPSRNCYFLDNFNNMLSVAEIRELLIRNELIQFKYLHRFSRLRVGNALVQFDDEWYMDYLYKNFFRFYCNAYNGSTDKMPRISYHLVPSGYVEVNVEKEYCYDGQSSVKIINTDDVNMFWEKPAMRKAIL